MNEITRIHIAKTAYDIEITAKKQLEKYIKSLEVYTQDADVLTDIEIRITEILAERNVAANGVITSADVAAVRAQLGEPHEFANDDGDIALGGESEGVSRRLYRSPDDAVLGGVLSGIAAYFNVNPLWTRLIFILLLFISFGFASLVYILFWIITPAARTATEKLQLAGKDVTLESIKRLNAEEESAPRRRIAPILQGILLIGSGVISALISAGVFIGVVTMVIAAFTLDKGFVDVTNGFTGLGGENMWLVWLLFWLVVTGLLLLTALFGLVAYALFAKKLTKRMIVSGIIIVVLGIVSFAAVVSVSATQSVRVANESRSMVRETKATLSKEFAGVTTVAFERKIQKNNQTESVFGYGYSSVRYVVDEGPARYEFSGLPSAKVSVKIEGTKAVIAMDIPDSFRNSFVQPTLTVYGHAVETIEAGEATNITYEGQTQASLTVNALPDSYAVVSGTYGAVTVTGRASVDLGSSTIEALTVNASSMHSVNAGTVRDLTVMQPEICPSGSHERDASVTVQGVTSGTMTYNGVKMPAASHQTGCAQVVIESRDDQGGEEGVYYENN